MPANFPEIWLDRVIHNLDNSDKATFLDGISELGVDVTQINAGDLSEQNKIYVPKSDFQVDVLINNSTYPIAVQEYDDDTLEITLDKYQTKVTTLSDDATIGASYEKIDVITKGHTHAISGNKYKKAIHAIAPAAHTVNTPVLDLEGDLTYEKLVAYRQLCDDAGFGDDDIRLTLCSKHWNNILLDRKNFGDQIVNYATGKPNPTVCGFELHKYSANPYYDTNGDKKPFGTAIIGTDKQASVAFVKEGIAKKTGSTRQYFAKAEPENQTNRLNYRHYFVVVPFQARQIGAMY